MTDRVYRFELQVQMSRRSLAAALVVAAFFGLAGRLASESVTVSTTYPAPFGVYNQLVTTGNAGTAPADTTLARNAGNVVLVPPTNAGGSVGIGTGSPSAKLDVAGTFRLRDGTEGAGKVLTSDASGRGTWQVNSAWPLGSYCVIQARGFSCPMGFAAVSPAQDLSGALQNEADLIRGGTNSSSHFGRIAWSMEKSMNVTYQQWAFCCK